MAISKTPISQDTIVQPKDKSFNFSTADLIYLFKNEFDHTYLLLKKSRVC